MIGLPPFLSFSENERTLQLKILMIILRTVKNISSLNIAASVLLFLAAILAAVVANSSLSPVYQDFLLQGAASAHRQLQSVFARRASAEDDRIH